MKKDLSSRIIIDPHKFSIGLNIYLRPSVVFLNYLPFAVDLEASTNTYKGQCEFVQSGHNVQILDAEISKSNIGVIVSVANLELAEILKILINFSLF